VLKKSFVIYGPPGTGKSTEIIRRLRDYMSRFEIPSTKIGLCSYTKTAAEVLAQKSELRSPWVGTIHSLAYRQSQFLSEQIVNSAKLKYFSDLTGILFRHNDKHNDKHNDIEDNYEDIPEGVLYLSLYSRCKSCLLDDMGLAYDALPFTQGSKEDFLSFVKKYDAWKKSHHYIDFNDMLELAIEADTPELSVLFVDEAQDLSNLQWKLVSKWAETIPHVHVAGDDDQAIYEWAGANPQGMHNFEKKFLSERVVLDQSYRLPKQVFKVAKQVLNEISDRVKKTYYPTNMVGEVNYYEDFSSIPDINEKEPTLILYRNRRFKKDVEKDLIDKGIPYLVDGEPGLCQSKEFKCVSLFLKIQKQGYATYALSIKENSLLESFIFPNLLETWYSIKKPTLFTKKWYDVFEIPFTISNYIEMLQYNHPYLNINYNIHLSTIHASKGREADRVILINGMGELSMETIYDGDISHEARVFYVAVTRAKKRLDIVNHDNSVSWLYI
jgi:DNA helicase-2/ATP-dependent DNA helicase PcrA